MSSYAVIHYLGSSVATGSPATLLLEYMPKYYIKDMYHMPDKLNSGRSQYHLHYGWLILTVDMCHFPPVFEKR
jgi:hypothetical protein